MQLLKYRVTDFRSVVDSEWVTTGPITAFIGENETGKTNLLLPLWKLNPAGVGAEIDILADMPRARYNALRDKASETTFVTALFSVEPAIAKELAAIAPPWEAADLVEVTVSRRFDGTQRVSFPKAPAVPMVPRKELQPVIESLRAEVAELVKTSDLWKATSSALQEAATWAGENRLATFETARAVLSPEALKVPSQHEKAGPVSSLIGESLAAAFNGATTHGPGVYTDVGKRILDTLPKSIYYSDYGTLSGRLHLPRVIEDLARSPDQLTETQRAQVRTIRVLFDFLRLKPQEILDLGRQNAGLPNQPPMTQEELTRIDRNKRERTVLLDSAAAELSKRFREWWQRGEYTFKFTADGDYFIIWVSDAQRPEPIELEGRSHGLQWFFSFFLVFLAESRGQHTNAILLLDEPGVTLHPLAQEDLFRFFDRLSKDNQLIYTAHSPFLVDPDRLSDVRVVYVGDAGETRISADLRKAERDKKRSRAVFAVDAALGLSASHTTMRYGNPTIVEGSSDQLYLSVCKTILIGAGKIQPSRELFFLPAGGVPAISTTASVIALTRLPAVLLDSDKSGREKAESLRRDKYAGNEELIIVVGDFVSGVPDAEIEDLMPREWLVEVVDRLYHSDTADQDFADVHDRTKPLVPQIEAFCDAQGILLEKPGWKVDLAAAVAQRALRKGVVVPEETMNAWKALFDRIIALEG